MPLYEYRCRACAKQFTFLAGVVADNDEARCPRCASGELQKLMSRVARGRSDDERMDSLADSLDEKNLDDPRELRRVAREMGREMAGEAGTDMGDELEAMIEAEARGEADDNGTDDGAGGGTGSGLASSNADDGTIY